MTLKLVVIAAMLLMAAGLKADTVYDITGIITSDGNNGASVTADYSYVLDVGSSLYGRTYATSDQAASGFGSLGSSFNLGNYNTSGYVPIFDPEGDEIDLLTGVNGAVPFSAEWWKCIFACIPDFMPPGFLLDKSVVNAGGNWGAAPFTMTETVTDSVTLTPETPTVILTLCGFLGSLWRKQKRTVCP